MQRFDALDSFRAPPGGVVLTIGNFDGVHVGHRAIIETAREIAARRGDAPVVVMTFDPHPLAILAPHHAPARLTGLGERLAILERLGVHSAIALRSDPALLSSSAEEFLARVVEHCRPCAFVEGPDFNFGRNRGGSLETLRQHADRYGYSVHAVDAVRAEVAGESTTVSSSAIRAALRSCDVTAAATMLGRVHRITGLVGHGAGRGAPLGAPTANLERIVQLVPGDGVYAAIAQLEDGAFVPAAVNVGLQPTFEQSEPRVEAHLIDVTVELRSRALGLHFVRLLRSQVKFSNVAALRQQIALDVAQSRQIAGDALPAVRESAARVTASA
ncbi:MAG: riboflavin biosynthesis protein RibF [Phycisphaerae bacterium]